MGHRGLFVGLTTLDLIYGVTHLPHANEKQVATEFEIAAGGPATNAAVTFRHLGNAAILLSGIGQHSVTGLIRADLDAQQVQSYDLLPERMDAPPLSSITVTQQNGDRAVVCRNALNWQASPECIPADCLRDVDVVLVDGHQIKVSVTIAKSARQRGIPVVLDGGSWKVGLEKVLPFVDYAICSADFLPPGCTTQAEVIQFLLGAIAQPNIAITRGGESIQYVCGEQVGEVAVVPIAPVDTLGAGDAFHGAFCHWILQVPFGEAVREAGTIAALACQEFGTRSWLERVSAENRR
ncbi:MAG: sugar kinase [Acaryochloridaceae cyanobacterium RU_4_10]|nr:sugar kinase [Acaryochloridaceae cyanobacterium RU_4_10]